MRCMEEARGEVGYVPAFLASVNVMEQKGGARGWICTYFCLLGGAWMREGGEVRYVPIFVFWEVHGWGRGERLDMYLFLSSGRCMEEGGGRGWICTYFEILDVTMVLKWTTSTSLFCTGTRWKAIQYINVSVQYNTVQYSIHIEQLLCFGCKT